MTSTKLYLLRNVTERLISHDTNPGDHNQLAQLRLLSMAHQHAHAHARSLLEGFMQNHFATLTFVNRKSKCSNFNPSYDFRLIL